MIEGIAYSSYEYIGGQYRLSAEMLDAELQVPTLLQAPEILKSKQEKAESEQLANSQNKTTDKNKDTFTKTSLSGDQLSDKEKKEVQELQRIDREVRAHEAAHQAAAGGIARGGASFTYSIGPDGKPYATGGEVSIDISPVSGDPDATIQKMQQVKRAALAPSDPSGQDRSVATKAAQIEAQARQEKMQTPVESVSKSVKSNNPYLKRSKLELSGNAINASIGSAGIAKFQSPAKLCSCSTCSACSSRVAGYSVGIA